MNRAQSRRMLNGLIWNTTASGPAGTWSGLPQDQDAWTCGHWIIYKDRLIKSIGLEAAKVILLNDAEAGSMWSAFNNSCHYDCEFVREFEALGPAFNFSVFSDVWCAGHRVTENIADAVADTSDAVSGTATIVKYAVPALLVAAIGYAVLKPKKFKKLIKI
jgi:hypothetical protein